MMGVLDTLLGKLGRRPSRALNDEIDRARELEVLSRQPRFSEDQFFASFLPWVSGALTNCPPYGRGSSMVRDSYLRAAWREEAHLAGVVNSVVLVDSNRGWDLVGPERQVARFYNRLHLSDGVGWRWFAKRASLSYWTTDMGAVTEVWRVQKGGPMARFNHVDSARCELTGDPEFPLKYHPVVGDAQRWGALDFFRTCSLPSDDEALLGLGFCAISRVLQIGALLLAVMQHDEERLGARVPEGMLLLSGITRKQWEDSLKQREAELDVLARKRYAAVQVLASPSNIDAKLVALSQLPEQFDRKAFVDLMLYSIALCFGYDPSEFWPVQFGALGRGTETQIQHMKATGKGGMDWATAFQECVQAELPETVLFSFRQRDDEGDLRAAEVIEAKARILSLLYSATSGEGGEPILSRDEVRQLAVQYGIIPSEWTPADEPTLQETRAREILADRREIWLARKKFPDEDIVCLSYPSGTVSRVRVSGVHATAVVRGDTESQEVLFDDGEVRITTGDVKAVIDQVRVGVGEWFAALLQAEVSEEIPPELATVFEQVL